MKKLDKKAFTLIELLVVIAVIGILVLFGAPRFTGYTQKAELTRIQHDIKVMEQEVGTVFSTDYDDFNKWEDNNKGFNQLIQEGKLFEKEGVVANGVEPIDEPYKVIPEKHKDKINTKLKGTFYANSNGKVYYEHLKPLSGIPTEPEKEPGYPDEENNDFIPVATAEELNSIRNDEERIYGEGTEWEGTYTGGLDKKYVQVSNIDLSEYSGSGWTPIGTYSSSFTGTYDGGNYVIKGLEVKGKGKEDQGLFGNTKGATIRNVGLENVNITGDKYVGGLVGWAEESFIENSYATGSVEGLGSAREADEPMAMSMLNINNPYVVTGEVTYTGYAAGGLVGYAGDSTEISNSYATGSVEGNEWVGGLVGEAGDSTKISNSYATGSVKGTGDAAGGLVGGAGNSTIENSYATGPVEGADNWVGGLVGTAFESFIENSYTTGSVKGTGSWKLGVGGLVGEAVNSTIDKSYATGAVEGAERVGGLVGMAQKSTIENSYATGLVSGDYYVGGLVGYAYNNSTISNSYSTRSVKGTELAGGLVGGADGNTTITNSYATGPVIGEDLVGGLVGLAQESNISNSYATGSVTGSSYNVGELDVGGLVGYVWESSIENSYWDTETTGQEKSAGAGATGKTTKDMMKQTTFSGWDFTNIWEITPGNYPTLR